LSVYASIFRLLNAACQICAFALDLTGYSKEFMFATSWAFLAAGPIFVLPIIKFWLKDTNMMEVIDSSDGNALQHEHSVVETRFEKKE
ncbi:hypothetical protein LTS18_000147, partial [Coniosporium uncinatum]